MRTLVVSALGLFALGASPVGEAKTLRRVGVDSVTLPVILPQIRIVAEPKGGFQFEFNNCDGGFWETVVFKGQGGEIIFATFNTPTIANASSSQVAIGVLRGNERTTNGCKAALKLEPSAVPKRKSLRGSVTQSSGEFAESQNGECHSEQKTDTIALKDIPYSRAAPFLFAPALADLRTLPGLKQATLTKMCD